MHIPIKFHLRIYDNFHYSDESEAYDFGEYYTYEEAQKAAQKVVYDSLLHNWKPNMSVDELSSAWHSFGDDPAILPDGPRECEMFSASKYVKSIIGEICSKTKV